jgi:hypothetical protein
LIQVNSRRARKSHAGRRRQQLGQFIRRQRVAEQITLHFGAAQCFQPLVLALRLHTFAGGDDLPRPRDFDDRLLRRRSSTPYPFSRVRRLARCGSCSTHRFIRQTTRTAATCALQIAERGIAGAKIVERDAP